MIKKQIRLVRGRSLNNWEMQNFSPLQDEFAISAVSPLYPDYDVHLIPFPVIKTRVISDYLASLPRFLQKLPVVRRFNSERFTDITHVIAGVDLVHSVDVAHVFNEQLVDAKAKANFKLVSTMWENIPFLWDGVGLNSQKIHKRKQKVLQGVDHFIAITERAKQTLLIEGADAAKITVLPMGIDVSRFTPQDKDPYWLEKLQLEPDSIIVLFVGRFTGYKGERELVMAASLLKQQGLVDAYKLRFVMVGGGDTAQISALIKRAGLESIFRVLSAPYEAMPKIHNLADIFYLGSWPAPVWQEQFGMVLIESMACGKPVIAAESGSIAEVVGDTGVLVPSGDFYRLSQELAALLQNPVERSKLSTTALQRARTHFDSQIVSQEIAKIYRQLL